MTECNRLLRNIRFQRSYSSGWAGALKIPAGFETSSNAAISLAQRQESLPELVQEFRTFISRVAVDYPRVIIGIDELDKLGSHEKAEQFLNEIKAIFNVPNCFYLVSVSENAISSFERRGMRFRDAFDSAFDDIRYVDYLTFEASRNLLARRVLNFPLPFIAICHALSAGLPRDLIRITRTMLDRAQRAPSQTTIAHIAKALISAEIQAKLQATAFAAREVAIEPQASSLLACLAKLENLDPAAPVFPTDCILPLGNTEADDDKAALRRLANLARDINSFLLFAITACQYFSGLQTEQQWNEAAWKGAVDQLAKARQALELSNSIADARLAAFRATQVMAPLVLN